MIQAFIKLAPRLFEVALSIITKLGEGLVEKVSELATPIADVWEWIQTTMENVFSKVTNVGANLVYGIWNGIRDTKNWLIKKLKQFCSDTLQAIKDFFGIESPSKVMADEVGTFMAEGIGVGFDKELPSVVKAMQAKLGQVVGAFQTDFAIGDIPQIQGNNIVSENSYVTKNYTNTIETIRQPQTIELTLDGTQVARGLIPALDQEYNRLGVRV